MSTQRKFPHRADHRGQWLDPALDRRSALKLFMAGVATTLASCGRPPEQIVPYVEMPEREVPGLPLEFASALPLGGYGRGVIITSIEGRPIKINGRDYFNRNSKPAVAA